MRAQPLLWLSLLAALGGTPAATAQQTTTTINFDDQLAGSDVSTAYAGQGLTLSRTAGVDPSVFTDFLPDTNMSDPNSNRGIDVASSGSGDLSALFSPTLYPNGVDFFSVDLVPGSSGSGVNNASVQFFGAGGNLIYTLSPIDQTMSQTLSTPNTVSGIQRVLLPADAFYDNLAFRGTLAATPEPGSLSLFLVGAGCLAAVALRRRLKKA